MTAVDGKLAFAATEDSTGTELYQTDDTAGTVLVEDLRPGTDSSNPSNLTDVAGTLFFAADDATAGTELWMSDGTEAGTSVVEDINPNGSDGSNPQELQRRERRPLLRRRRRQRRHRALDQRRHRGRDEHPGRHQPRCGQQRSRRAEGLERDALLRGQHGGRRPWLWAKT